MNHTFRKWILLFAVVLLISQPLYVEAASPTVRAVLFYSPTCGHCHVVISEVLPPLEEAYGDQLVIAYINVSEELGVEIYRNAIIEYKIPQERLGVPTMIVGDTVLVGAGEIPDQFPGLIQQGLASGGIEWPEITGLEPLLVEVVGVEEQSLAERFGNDLLGNSIAVAVLLAMLASVVGVVWMNRQKRSISSPGWTIPALALVGFGVAIYMSYIEVTQVEAICGPIGDCNTVQQSAYASLFGIIPIGILGAVGYLAIMTAWAVREYGPILYRQKAARALGYMIWFGVLFSIYLTFLEPFVIGATCVWCIASALIMTSLLWLSVPTPKQSKSLYRRVRAQSSP